jgi:hypothetical protein
LSDGIAEASGRFPPIEFYLKPGKRSANYANKREFQKKKVYQIHFKYSRKFVSLANIYLNVGSPRNTPQKAVHFPNPNSRHLILWHNQSSGNCSGWLERAPIFRCVGAAHPHT